MALGGSITQAINKLIRNKRICEQTIGGSKSSAETNLHHRKIDIYVQARKAQLFKKKIQSVPAYRNTFLIRAILQNLAMTSKAQIHYRSTFSSHIPSTPISRCLQSPQTSSSPAWLPASAAWCEAQPPGHSDLHWHGHAGSLLAHGGAAILSPVFFPGRSLGNFTAFQCN